MIIFTTLFSSLPSLYILNLKLSLLLCNLRFKYNPKKANESHVIKLKL